MIQIHLRTQRQVESWEKEFNSLERKTRVPFDGLDMSHMWVLLELKHPLMSQNESKIHSLSSSSSQFWPLHPPLSIGPFDYFLIQKIQKGSSTKEGKALKGNLRVKGRAEGRKLPPKNKKGPAVSLVLIVLPKTRSHQRRRSSSAERTLGAGAGASGQRQRRTTAVLPSRPSAPALLPFQKYYSHPKLPPKVFPKNKRIVYFISKAKFRIPDMS